MLKQKFTARMLTLTGVSLLSLAAASSIDAATSNANLSVTATVTASCSITTTPVAFGAYDPLVANASTALNGTGAINATCTSGASTTIALGEGSSPAGTSTPAAPARRMSDGQATPHYLTYSLYQDNGRSQVWGNTLATSASFTGTGTSAAVTVYGTVDAGQSAPPGSYSDTVVATITF
jgi:spore coat protein U-like protein